MKTEVVRTWLIYFFTLLAVAALNVDGVVSWCLSKGEGPEDIRIGLAALKTAHSESIVGVLLTSLECAAGPVFEGSYKDKSRCRAFAGERSSLASRQSPGPLSGPASATLQSTPALRTLASSDEALADHSQARGERAPSMVMREADGATRDHLAWEALIMGTSEEVLERAAPGGPVPVECSDSETSGCSPDSPAPLASREAEGALESFPSIPGDSPPMGAISGRSLCGEAFGRNELQSVLLVGDSLAHGLALSLGRELKDRKGAVFSFVAKVASGLNNPNVFNWERTVRMLIEHGAPDLLLVMMGVNDANNHIREGNRLCAVGTPEWGQAYENKVESFLRIASENNVQVCWIGIPVVREEGLQNRVLLANMAAKNACGRVENCRFIDTFEALCDENKRYTNYLKEPNGSSVRIRAKDGIHFSMEGSHLLSSYILRKLETDLTEPSARN